MGQGKGMITLVVAGHGHDRAGTVGHQHEIADPDRQFLARNGMDRLETGIDALLLLGFQLGRRSTALPAFGDEIGHACVVRRCPLRQRMFGCDREEGDAHQRVRPGGEHLQRFPAAGNIETDLQTFRAPQPVALHGLDRIGPALQRVQSIQQFLGVIGDLQKPLRNLALFHRRTGTPAAAVDHLFVGQHGLVHRVPVDHRVAPVGQPLFEQAHEHALLVHVVIGIAGGELARPVIGKAHALELPAHVRDVLAGPFGRRHPVLDGCIFGRQAKGIPADRLQHVAALHALEAADHVADGVVAHMSDMQRTGGIRQHRQAIVLLAPVLFGHFECPGSGPIVLRGLFHGARIVVVAHRFVLAFMQWRSVPQCNKRAKHGLLLPSPATR